MSSRYRHIGPATEGTIGWFGYELEVPRYGNRFEQGLSPKRPHCVEGPRMDPPMSVPMPITDPFPANKAASPPLEPPGHLRLSNGFLVTPRFDDVSLPNIAIGTVVLT
ncbi:hypothetical protein OGATHE_000859 [Ogataea polymorpha]|uniref:Uncharacterized protein n=1 Tax=Ogataea polymorpha TaxID=460523 RepID=A0A9P8PTL9_9ASCO|nr:hypothetical protein OGATHE_000859 [Ogataea polymorpha]